MEGREKYRPFPTLEVSYLHVVSKTRYSTTGSTASEADINGYTGSCGYTYKLIKKGMYSSILK